MRNCVNFLPQEIQQHSTGLRMLQRYYWLTIILFVVGVLTSLPYYSAEQKTLKEIESHIATAERSFEVQTQLCKVNRSISDLQSLVNQHQQLIGQHPPLACLAVLSEFVAKNQDSVQVIEMTYENLQLPNYSNDSNPKQPSPANPTNGSENAKGKLNIKARLLDPSLATSFIDALKKSNRFKAVQLNNHSVDHQSDSYLSEIDLSCSF